MNRFFCSFASDEGVTQKNSLHNFSNSEVTTDKVKKQNLSDYFNEVSFFSLNLLLFKIFVKSKSIFKISIQVSIF